MKKYLKIPTTGDKGTVYINVLDVLYARPVGETPTQTQLVCNLVNSDGELQSVYLVHASETDNATTRWWYDNLKNIVETPYEEVMFLATTPPFEISDISFSEP